MKNSLRRLFSSRVLAALSFCLSLLTPVSLLLAVQFLRSGNTVDRWVERPIVIDRLSPVLKDASLRKGIWACLSREIDTVSREGLAPGSEIVVTHYLHGKEGLRREVTTEGSLSQPPQQIPEQIDFSEDGHLAHAYRTAGYAETPMWSPGLAGTNRLLRASPYYLTRWLEDVTGERIVPISTSVTGNFFPGDHLYDCIERLDSKSLKIAALYALGEKREFLNPVVIENRGDVHATDVFVYVSRAWQGRFSVIEKSVQAAGGEILHAGTFSYVIKFPSIAEKSHKAIVVRTASSELRDDQVRVEFVQQRSVSDWWLVSGLLLIIAFGVLHYKFAET